MLNNAYLLAKIGADTAENERNFAEILPKISRHSKTTPRRSPAATRLLEMMKQKSWRQVQESLNLPSVFVWRRSHWITSEFSILFLLEAHHIIFNCLEGFWNPTQKLEYRWRSLRISSHVFCLRASSFHVFMSVAWSSLYTMKCLHQIDVYGRLPTLD